jgi:peptidoglycan/LPS O-acetylase OafA/YrhL
LLYLGVIAILAHFSVIPVTRAELMESLFFCRNTTHFLHITSDQYVYYTNHFWSLSLEEQFYLFLPASLVFIAKRYRAHALGVVALVVCLYRALALRSHPWMYIQFHTDVRIDALLVPAVFAILAWSPQNRPIFQKYLRCWPLLVVVFLMLVPFGNGAAWQITAFVWLLPAIVLGSVLNPENIFGRLLESSVLRYIGRVSYSLYLWQQLFFTDHFVGSQHPLGWLQSWPLRLVLTFAIAVVSYHFLERPLMALGHTLAPPATTGERNLGSPPMELIQTPAAVSCDVVQKPEAET